MTLHEKLNLEFYVLIKPLNLVNQNLNKVKVLDASWHLPNVKRNSFEEYKTSHITNSVFFDIDKYSNQKTNLPHMLPSKKDWEIIVSNLGISNSDHIIVYDNSEVFSSCRVWYTFLYFGHNPDLISILDGNFEKWVKEKRPVSKEIAKNEKSNYTNLEDIKDEVIKAKKTFQKYKWPVIDVTRKSVEETAASIIKIHEIYSNNGK